LRSPAVSGFAVLLAATLMGILPASSEADPSGVWLTQAGDARIQVSRCGAGICGRIVWLRDPIDARTGQPQVDDKNPNPALAQRPIIGLSILIGMQPSGPGKWSGRIYNADDGQTYTAHVTLQNDTTLEVEGCVGAMLCGGETWTRFASTPPPPPAMKKSAPAK
jgi:uncharacterized protein (DUF2147 family)